MDLRVTIDSRERNSELIEALEALGVKISVQTLHVGDYVLSDRVCIERKTVRDFESSLMNARLFEQAERLKEHYGSPILIIEGDRNDFRLGSNVITGAIAHLYIDIGMQVINSSDASDTAKIIAILARHEQHPKRREPSIKGGARAYNDEQYKEYMIGNLPGVGLKTARKLLNHFRSVRKIADAEVRELMEIDKIGKKKAGRIHKIINNAYKPSEVEP
jgi:ERCC4-type nuclease